MGRLALPLPRVTIDSPPAASSPTLYNFFDIRLSIGADPLRFGEEFERVFGRGWPSAPASDPGVDVSHVSATESWATLRIDGDALESPAAFLAGFSSPDIPLTGAGDDAVCVGDDPTPILRFDGAQCSVRLVDGWRRIVSHMVFLRLIRLRPDLLFFHAAAVGINGRAFLLIGPKGRGKTTTSMALAARGHAFLGDETAVFEPSTSLVLPFRRPVGVKRGPCATAVSSALTDTAAAFPAEGILRVPIGKVLDVADAAALPLGGVVFLQPFAPEPRLEKVTAGRDELAQMQPLANAPGGVGSPQRVFAMIRLLGSTRCFKLWPADPDQTAIHIERMLSDEP